MSERLRQATSAAILADHTTACAAPARESKLALCLSTISPTLLKLHTHWVTKTLFRQPLQMSHGVRMVGDSYCITYLGAFQVVVPNDSLTELLTTNVTCTQNAHHSPHVLPGPYLQFKVIQSDLC